ncbi:MAG: ribonuclease HII [Simkaniaceae bacterium]|nr:ribonuclease HII [Candidatus Sacchlamyda saccharinae]
MRAQSAKRKETYRLKRLCSIEEEVRNQGFEVIAGVDEAGRGPLAGPLVASACILPEGYTLRGIDDSKKLNEKLRYTLYQDLILHPNIDFGIGIVEPSEIDELNIHNATLEAMKRACQRLTKTPQFLLIDGCHTFDSCMPSEAVVDGDQKAQSIAAASIIAKVTRDHIMMGYHDLYPEYGFKNHKGYGTKEHMDALDELGATPIHRMSFGRLKNG